MKRTALLASTLLLAGVIPFSFSLSATAASPLDGVTLSPDTNGSLFGSPSPQPVLTGGNVSGTDSTFYAGPAPINLDVLANDSLGGLTRRQVVVDSSGPLWDPFAGVLATEASVTRGVTDGQPISYEHTYRVCLAASPSTCTAPTALTYSIDPVAPDGSPVPALLPSAGQGAPTWACVERTKADPFSCYDGVEAAVREGKAVTAQFDLRGSVTQSGGLFTLSYRADSAAGRALEPYLTTDLTKGVVTIRLPANFGMWQGDRHFSAAQAKCRAGLYTVLDLPEYTYTTPGGSRRVGGGVETTDRAACTEVAAKDDRIEVMPGAPRTFHLLKNDITGEGVRALPRLIGARPPGLKVELLPDGSAKITATQRLEGRTVTFRYRLDADNDFNGGRDVLSTGTPATVTVEVGRSPIIVTGATRALPSAAVTAPSAEASALGADGPDLAWLLLATGAGLVGAGALATRWKVTR